MSRLDRKLGVWFTAAVLAAVSAGCALDAGEPTDSTGTDLDRAAAVPMASQVPLAAAPARPIPPTQFTTPSTPLAIPVQAAPGVGIGNDWDDPRPHPWQPPSSGGTTATGASGTEGSTSSDSTGATGSSSK